MTDTKTHDLLIDLGKKKDDPNIPLAPFKRFIKIHTKGKYVSDEASETLRVVFYEFAEEVITLADTFAQLHEERERGRQLYR